MVVFLIEPKRGLEPPTYGLQNRCSTIELFRQRWLVRRAGFEPATLCLKGICSTTELTAHILI